MNSFFDVDESYPSIFLCFFFFLYFLRVITRKLYTRLWLFIFEYLNMVLNIEIFL